MLELNSMMLVLFVYLSGCCSFMLMLFIDVMCLFGLVSLVLKF